MDTTEETEKKAEYLLNEKKNWRVYKDNLTLGFDYDSKGQRAG